MHVSKVQHDVTECVIWLHWLVLLEAESQLEWFIRFFVFFSVAARLSWLNLLIDVLTMIPAHSLVVPLPILSVCTTVVWAVPSVSRVRQLGGNPASSTRFSNSRRQKKEDSDYVATSLWKNEDHSLGTRRICKLMFYLRELDPLLFRQISSWPGLGQANHNHLCNMWRGWIKTEEGPMGAPVMWCVTSFVALIGFRSIQLCPEAFRSVAIDNATRKLKTGQPEWTLGLGETAHLLQIEQSMCTG